MLFHTTFLQYFESMSANETTFRNPYLCKLSIDRPSTVFMEIGLAMEYSVERAVSCLCIVCCLYNLKIYTSLLTAMLPSFLSFFLLGLCRIAYRLRSWKKNSGVLLDTWVCPL